MKVLVVGNPREPSFLTILRAYGAEIVVYEPPKGGCAGLDGCLLSVDECTPVLAPDYLREAVKQVEFDARLPHPTATLDRSRPEPDWKRKKYFGNRKRRR